MKKYLHATLAATMVLLGSGHLAAAETTDSQKVQVQKSSQGQQVVDYAMQFIGTPYASGGTDLSSGVDCSGYVQQVYKKFGVKLAHSSKTQYSSAGYSIEKEDLQPGDLVFYGSGSVNHVAIYIGGNKIVHAPVPGKSVCTAPVWQRGDQDIIGYKRVIE